MKKFLVKVNGNSYEVEVEEVKDNSKHEPKGDTKPQVPRAPHGAHASKEKRSSAAAKSGRGASVTAPMPGTIVKVNVSVGDEVEKGAVLLVLEAMKMENEIAAPAAGKITAVNVKKGASVNAGDVLVTIE